MLRTVSQAILEPLAQEQRRVFADWRALLLLRRATFATPRNERRWTRLPKTVADIAGFLQQMMARGEIELIPHARHIYQVTVPYAQNLPLNEYECLMEAHPYCTLSHASAFTFHGLSDDLENRIIVTATAKRPADLLPSGTTIEDWENLALPTGIKLETILERPVKWKSIDNRLLFGVTTYSRYGFPLRVTDRERTLLDGLQEPDLCGGFAKVLQAWKRSRDMLRVDTVLDYTERLESAVLRQRVGYLLELLDIEHPRLDDWQRHTQRGGSSKLLGSAPYTIDGQRFWSERWNLAINIPLATLEEAD